LMANASSLFGQKNTKSAFEPTQPIAISLIFLDRRSFNRTAACFFQAALLNWKAVSAKL
jgi:hypothetical protein